MVVHIYRPDSLAEQIDFWPDKCHKCLENDRCPAVISSSDLRYTLHLPSTEYLVSSQSKFHMTVVFHNIANDAVFHNLLCHKPGTPNVAIPLVKSRLDCSNSSINHVGLHGGKVETK